MANITHLCDQVSPAPVLDRHKRSFSAVGFETMLRTAQVLEISDYRTDLYDYLKNRMMAIAPNLTVLVGEMVGARLIAHAGETPITFA